MAQKNDEGRKRVELLIETLASTNSAPPMRGDVRRGDDLTIRFPDKYDAKKQVPEAEPLEKTEFDKRRIENIKTLTAIRRFVTETGKRYRTTRVEGAHDCIFGLPWAGRKFNK